MNTMTIKDIETFSRYIPNFLFILLRTGIFVSLLPVLNDTQLPKEFKIGLAVSIALLLTPIIQFEIAENNIPIMIVKEIFMGMALGLTVRFLFLGINMAGSFISHSIGMSLATAFNPEIGQSTQISETLGIIAMLIFFITDAHHDLILIFVKSFELVPAGHVNIGPIIQKMLSMGNSMFVLGLKISAPVIVISLITYLLSGFLYKAAPQMNIFFIALPLNIFLGLMTIILCIPAFEHVIGIEFSNLRQEMSRILMMTKG